MKTKSVKHLLKELQEGDCALSVKSTCGVTKLVRHVRSVYVHVRPDGCGPTTPRAISASRAHDKLGEADRALAALREGQAAVRKREAEEAAALAALGSDSRSQTATSRPHPREQSHHGNTSGPWATLSNTETSSSMRRIPVGSTQCLIGCHSGSTPLRADTAVVER